ncbi:MAG TPA: hypothetical protein VE691_17460 [Rubrobacter sp.]|nr:hypothetical protein [Rubrobacter sp.]
MPVCPIYASSARLRIMGAGYLLLTRLGYGSSQTDLTLDMVVVGLGLGAVLLTYTLVVQNATSREDLGVATSTTQLSRSLGATLGTAIFGIIMTNGIKTEIPKHLPPQALEGPQAAELSEGGGVGTVLDPNTLGQLPEAVTTGIREGLAAAMHPVFVAGLPIIAIAFVATLFIKELPLRTVAFADIEGDATQPDDADARDSDSIDTTLTPPGTQYGATLGNAEKREPFGNAGFATICKPLQHVNYHS